MPVAGGMAPCPLKGLVDIKQVPLFPFVLISLVGYWKTERKLETPFLYAPDTHLGSLRETPSTMLPRPLSFTLPKEFFGCLY